MLWARFPVAVGMAGACVCEELGPIMIMDGIYAHGSHVVCQSTDPS